MPSFLIFFKHYFLRMESKVKNGESESFKKLENPTFTEGVALEKSRL